MLEKYLPLGTVVLLKGGVKKVMITGYLIYSSRSAEKKVMYDYGGCTFPEGILNADQTLVFNHDQIERIVHLGFENDEQAKFNDLLKQEEGLIRKKFEEVSQAE